MKKYFILLGIFMIIGFLQANASKSGVFMNFYKTGHTDQSTAVRRSPMQNPFIEVIYDSDTHKIEITGDESMQAEVFLYNSNGTLDNYSSSLNIEFTVLTSGTYIILIQGDGWYAEGEIEV